MNILKVTEQFTLHGWIAWYVNYASIKTFEKKTVFEKCILLRLYYFQDQNARDVLTILPFFFKSTLLKYDYIFNVNTQVW